jgi:hypothetical protein
VAGQAGTLGTVPEEVRIDRGDGSDVSALVEEALAPIALSAVAHGAGGDMRTSMLGGVSAGLATHDVSCLRFNFPYAEAGRRGPDRPPTLLDTWRGALAAAAVLALSFLVLPTWVGDWRAGLGKLDYHPAPILTFPGALAALALLRWRRPEARLLVAMACVPQLLFFADQLPLWLIPRTKRETMALSACSLAAFLGWFVLLKPGDYYVMKAAPWVTSFLYLPALVMVLRRPNEGEVPAPVAQLLALVRRPAAAAE